MSAGTAVDTPPAASGHVWLFSLSGMIAHQFPDPTVPDAEDILTALCGAEVMAFRVLDEFRPPLCWDCLIAHGTGEADRQEAWMSRMAASNRVTS